CRLRPSVWRRSSPARPGSQPVPGMRRPCATPPRPRMHTRRTSSNTPSSSTACSRSRAPTQATGSRFVFRPAIPAFSRSTSATTATPEGQTRTDTMVCKGANTSEQVDLSANGNRLNVFRTQGRITMDTAGVERVDFNALGGADLVTVNDLTGTDVSDVNVDLA